MQQTIKIRQANENNLKNVDVEVPRNQIVVVTGVSGSGKSTLVYDIIYKEAERKFLESFSSNARQLFGKLTRPNVEHISGLSPAIAVNQRTVIRNPRSTVGTLTELHDYLRLLFARLGKAPEGFQHKIERRLFSFNSPQGACPHCKGLGVEDRLDPELLVEDPSKSLRDGALVITTPSGYIVYSQVTMDVMEQVCQSEGFSTDIPWKDLTPKQKHIVLYGSDKIKIPYGKHTLESRMKWSGITAKPREEGYYKGILPVMEVILKRDRNKNILRFVRSATCSVCGGDRLRPEVRDVKFQGRSIVELLSLSIEDINDLFSTLSFDEKDKEAGEVIREAILKRTALLVDLGLGYLCLSRESTSLSGGEAQRIRLANQAGSGLRNILYVLDEPSIGLHDSEKEKMLGLLKVLRDNGNTVLVVEHDEDFMRTADHLIDIGPKAGKLGGEVLFSGRVGDALARKDENQSQTIAYLKSITEYPTTHLLKDDVQKKITLKGATLFNLKNVDVEFYLSKFNVVTGVSGAGKGTLTHRLLGEWMKNGTVPEGVDSIFADEKIDRIIEIDQSPIGKTPRSNPATYTKLSDRIRDLFASLPETKERGWKKGRFSFNNKGGRCEHCEGAGAVQVGMHFLGNVDVLCSHCQGKRFNDETLEIRYKGKNIFEVLEMQVDEALEFFREVPPIKRILKTMNDLGLGYIALGQKSTTLSGGEAQRIKLATELAKNTRGHVVYMLDEPTTGLHPYDVKILLRSIHSLVENGNTVVAIEHDPDFILEADHVVDLGPGSGTKGGQVTGIGHPSELIKTEASLTGLALQKKFSSQNSISSDDQKQIENNHPIAFKNVSTHNLKGIDVEFPVNQLTVITGVSGSGKSSLAFDTLFAEGQKRFVESFSAYIRSLISTQSEADFEEASGIMPTIAISQKQIARNPRSTVGTISELADYYRLLFSRAAVHPNPKTQPLQATAFSFNNEEGACPVCKGLGTSVVCDPEKLVANPNLPLVAGALNGTKTGKFYGDPNGQYVATLLEVGRLHVCDFSKPWNLLSEQEKNLAMYGAGEEEFSVTWKFQRKERSGEHHFTGKWPGFVGHVNEEYDRKHADNRGDAMLPIMKTISCDACAGSRMKAEILEWSFAGKSIHQLNQLSIKESIALFEQVKNETQVIAADFSELENKKLLTIAQPLIDGILPKLKRVQELGLDYLEPCRASSTLSGGEAQRLRLAGMLNAGLTGVCYVLDEPTVGLHSSNTQKLIDTLQRLCQQGNTVVVVEHDEEVIRSAHHIIDMGPKAGNLGGEIMAQGKIEDVMASNSLTALYLNHKQEILFPKSSNINPKGIFIQGARANNLQHIDVHLPTNALTVVSGVSGSGKTSLVFDVLHKSAQYNKAIACNEIEGLEQFDEVISFDGSAVHQSTSSNCLTYTGIFTAIRDLFAGTSEAKTAKLAKKHFSFNQKGGRCETCQGQGRVKVSMDFLSDVFVICDDCNGKRFMPEVLACKYKGKSISDVLEMTIAEGKMFFNDQKKLAKAVGILYETGLSYLKMGQALSTYSGGELQRLKLANTLISGKKGNTLFLMDEPTTGLHFEDVNTLMKIIARLIAEGHSVIMVEHHPDIIRLADRVIELGPGGGAEGGKVVE